MEPSGIDALTPSRLTIVEFNTPETSLARPSWSETRDSSGIAPQQARGVTRQEGGGWGVTPQHVLTIVKAADTAITPEKNKRVKLAPGHSMASIAPAPYIPKSSIPPSLIEPVDSPVVIKRVSAPRSASQHAQEADDDGAWDSEITNPYANFTKIPMTSEQDTMRRVFSSNTSHPENNGFLLRFWLPDAPWEPAENVINMYWGGPTALTSMTDPQDSIEGGRYCLNVRGDGTVTVYEYVRDPRGIETDSSEHAMGISARRAGRWIVRQAKKMFSFTSPMAGTLCVEPQAVSKSIAGTWAISVQGGNTGASMIAATPASPAIPNSGPPLAAHPKPRRKAKATGRGPVEVETPQTKRVPFQVAEVAYTTVGTLMDSPFTIPFPIVAGSKFTFIAQALTPGDSFVRVSVVAADTGTTLGVAMITRGSTGAVECNAPDSGNRCYAIYELHPSSNNRQTPVVFGSAANVQGQTTTTRTTPIVIADNQYAAVKSVNISGPDLDASHETASMEIEDFHPTGDTKTTTYLEPLKMRGRIRARISTRYDADPSHKVVLFDGETSIVKATLKGKNGGQNGVSELWRTLDCTMVGMWARLHDQMAFARTDFLKDPSSPTVNGVYQPWRITDIIRYCFRNAGIPDSMLDIPTYPARALPSGRDANEYLLQPTTNFMEYCQKLARDYLGAYILWEPNLGANGKWRLLRPAVNINDNPTPLWTFYATDYSLSFDPESAEHDSAQTKYPLGSSPIFEYSSYDKAPEANYVVVTATGLTTPSADATSMLTAFAWNPVSFDIDPSHPTADVNHPDYLGRFVPLVYFDTTLGIDPSGETINMLLRRLTQQTCHSQKWIDFTAPLVFTTDTGLHDPSTPFQHNDGAFVRPLRMYDPILIRLRVGDTVLEQTCVIRSVNIDYKTDRVQMAHYQAMALVDPGGIHFNWAIPTRKP